MTAFLVLTVLQGVLILVDEIFFHHARGLPRWERMGHPMDTGTVLACLLFVGLAPKTAVTETIYYAMVIFSCVFITKDEWVHRKFCSGTEMWLHALLFIVHPLLLFSAVFIWQDHQELILMIAAGVVIFMVYQIVYWNFIEYKLQERRRAALYADLSQEDRYDYFRE